MKILLAVILLLTGLSSSAAIPSKITVVGLYKGQQKGMVFIRSGNILLKVPKNTVLTPKFNPGEQIVAKVPVDVFMKDN